MKTSARSAVAAVVSRLVLVTAACVLASGCAALGTVAASAPPPQEPQIVDTVGLTAWPGDEFSYSDGRFGVAVRMGLLDALTVEVEGAAVSRYPDLPQIPSGESGWYVEQSASEVEAGIRIDELDIVIGNADIEHCRSLPYQLVAKSPNPAHAGIAESAAMPIRVVRDAPVIQSFRVAAPQQASGGGMTEFTVSWFAVAKHVRVVRGPWTATGELPEPPLMTAEHTAVGCEEAISDSTTISPPAGPNMIVLQAENGLRQRVEVRTTIGSNGVHLNRDTHGNYSGTLHPPNITVLCEPQIARVRAPTLPSVYAQQPITIRREPFTAGETMVSGLSSGQATGGFNGLPVSGTWLVLFSQLVPGAQPPPTLLLQVDWRVPSSC